jgi:hypothetical protein
VSDSTWSSINTVDEAVEVVEESTDGESVSIDEAGCPVECNPPWSWRHPETMAHDRAITNPSSPLNRHGNSKSIIEHQSFITNIKISPSSPNGINPKHLDRFIEPTP